MLRDARMARSATVCKSCFISVLPRKCYCRQQRFSRWTERRAKCAVFQEITFANQLPTGVQKEILQMKCGYLKKNNNTFHSNNNIALEVQVSKQPLLK